MTTLYSPVDCAVRAIVLALAIAWAAGCHTSEKGDCDGDSRVLITPEKAASPVTLANDFKSGRSGERMFRFAIKNRFPGTAKLSVAGKSCACVDVGLKPENMCVRGILEMEPDTSGVCEIVRSIPPEAGVYNASVLLQASYPDGKKEHHRLATEAKVYDDFAFVPRCVQVDVPEQIPAAISRDIVVRARFRKGKRAEKGLRASTGANWLSISSIEATGRPTQMDTGVFEQPFRATVMCNAAKALQGRGSALAHVLFSFTESGGIEDTPTGRVSISLRRTQGLVFPEKILFGTLAVGEVQRRRVVIRSADGSRFAILGATSSRREIEVDCRVADRKGACQAWLSLACHPSVIGPIEGRVTIKTDHPSDHIVVLSVQASCVDRAERSTVARVQAAE